MMVNCPLSNSTNSMRSPASSLRAALTCFGIVTRPFDVMIAVAMTECYFFGAIRFTYEGLAGGLNDAA